MSKIKNFVRRQIARNLASLLAHLPLDDRITIFRRVLRVENLIENFSRAECLKFFLVSARQLSVQSFAVNGELGVYEGSITDENVHGRYALEGRWAPALQRLLISDIFRGGKGTYLDIGANIGLTLIPVASATRAHCIAFEPEPRNFSFLRKNVITNGLEDKITLHNYALYSERTNLQFELSTWNLGDHRVRRSDVATVARNDFRENERQTIWVPAQRLDDVLRPSELQRPLVCKVDTQGAEVQVLCGARDSLRFVDMLVIEYWPYGLLRMGDSTENFIAAIQGFSYGEIRSLDASDAIDFGRQLEPIDRISDKLREIGKDRSGGNYVDLLLTRNLNLC